VRFSRRIPTRASRWLKYRGYHHFCLNVTSVDETVATLRSRGVTIVTEPFELAAISRRLAFFDRSAI
jgi:lactoylglutathione lyase/glyoxylase I family protein